MSLFTTTEFGNIIDIRQAGKNQVIVLAPADFRKDKSTPRKNKYVQIMSFARQAKVVDMLKARLNARRQETGNDKAALTNVKVEVYISLQQDGSLQAQLSKVILDDEKPAAKDDTKNAPVVEEEAPAQEEELDIEDAVVPF